MPLAIKLVKMVTHNEEFPLINTQDFSITWFRQAT